MEIETICNNRGAIDADVSVLDISVLRSARLFPLALGNFRH